MSVTKQLMGPIDFFPHTMGFNGALGLFGCPYSSEYLLLGSPEERNPFKFGTT